MEVSKIGISECELFKKYKSSYKLAFIDISIHFFYLALINYLLVYLQNSLFSIFIVPILALLNIKTFIIFHDCGHNSYTPNKTVNYIIGFMTGTLIYYPFSWNYRHHTHHLTNGNYENKYDYSYNELIFFSFDQYKELSVTKRSVIKIILSPYMVFGLITYVYFLILERMYIILFFKRKYATNPNKVYLIMEQLTNNLGVILIFYLQYKYSIFYPSLFAYFISATCGSILFFNQHTFNPPYVVDNKTWNVKDSGIKGSSFIQIPSYLKYFTGGIEYHHIHHFNPKIPSYNLQKYHETVVNSSKIFDDVKKLSIQECFNNLSLAVYNEKTNRFITFLEADELIQEIIEKEK